MPGPIATCCVSKRHRHAFFAGGIPPDQTFDSRRRCLEHLRSIGYQVGTGVMIGAPWQTTADLAADVAFFKDSGR
jgi:biotin synthase